MKKTFSKRDKRKCSYILDETTEFIKDTIPSYYIDKLPDCYNEALLKKTMESKKKNEKLNVSWNKSKCLCRSELKLANLVVKTET